MAQLMVLAGPKRRIKKCVPRFPEHMSFSKPQMILMATETGHLHPECVVPGKLMNNKVLGVSPFRGILDQVATGIMWIM
jgi:hypothetical protein